MNAPGRTSDDELLDDDFTRATGRAVDQGHVLRSDGGHIRVRRELLEEAKPLLPPEDSCDLRVTHT